MCDIAHEREQIDAILETAYAARPNAAEKTEIDLVELGIAALCQHYADLCSEDCMRQRCLDFMARRAFHFSSAPTFKKFPALMATL
jgi:hypothetical protein